MGNCRGEANGRAKFTEKEVMAIREAYANEDVSQRDLAKKFDTTQTVISKIIAGKLWGHLPLVENKVKKAVHCARNTPADIRLVAHLSFPSMTDCWEFNGSLSRGYGQMAVNGKRVRAHRQAYLMWVGPIEQGLMVCHTCDNRLCCNPDHLFLGTDQDNTDDMCNKHRQAAGEKQAFAKLTKESILAAKKERLEKGTTYDRLGKKYGVNGKTIWRAITGKSWDCINWDQ